jgi:hypothetical protein
MVTYKLLEICKNILDKEEIEFLQKKIKETFKKKIKRENFIKIIEIIRNNKYIFKSLGYLDLYNKLLKKLYCEIECLININNKFYQENYFSIHQQINSIEKLNNSIYLEDIIGNIPGLEILIYHYNNCKNYHQIDLNDNILIEIADTGDGINQEFLPRIFERFYRVDKSRSRSNEAGGTGLGLAIVKHIIEAHHQTVNVRSTIGKGTTFGFTLKAVQ